MRSVQGCKSCLFRNATALLDEQVKDDLVKSKLEKEIIELLVDSNGENPPPVLYHHIIQIISKGSTERDPYKKDKQKQNEIALSLEDDLRRRIEKSADSFLEAIKVSITGNTIDLGAYGRLNREDILRDVEEGLGRELETDKVEQLRKAVLNAKSILFIGDNAGEIVFDKLLVEQIDPSRVNYAVRGYPVINDATFDDATEVGMDILTTVIDNGSDYPGTVLESCSIEFQELFTNADLIISKGQGNYETLSDTTRPVFFLFKVKCDEIAALCGYPVGKLVIVDSHELLK